MHKMSESNLEAAFAGESQAHMRYMIFADRAEKQGFANIARLFRAISFAEQVHATNHWRTLGRVGDTAENLSEAIGGENFEVQEMYPAYVAVSDLQKEAGAERSNKWALEAEKVHASMYETAREAASGGKDVELGQVYICSVCGWTGEGEPPDKCPVCGAIKEKFVKF